MSCLIVCDLEFSGVHRIGDQLHFDPIVTDLLTGCMIAVTPNLELIDSFDFKAQPIERRGLFSGEETHGITFYEAMKFPHPKETIAKLTAWLDTLPKPIWFVNHAFPRSIPVKVEDRTQMKRRNKMGEMVYPKVLSGAVNWGNIDYHVLHWFFTKQNQRFDFWRYFNEKRLISSSALAEHFKQYTGLADNKLDTLASYFKIKLEHHNARSDAEATLQIMRCLARWGSWWDFVECEELPQGLIRRKGTDNSVSNNDASVNDGEVEEFRLV